MHLFKNVKLDNHYINLCNKRELRNIMIFLLTIPINLLISLIIII